VLAPSAHRASIEPRSSALSAHRALGALLAPFGRPTQLTLRPRAAEAGFRFADANALDLTTTLILPLPPRISRASILTSIVFETLLLS